MRTTDSKNGDRSLKSPPSPPDSRRNKRFSCSLEQTAPYNLRTVAHSMQWAVLRLDIDAAWKRGRGDEGRVVWEEVQRQRGEEGEEGETGLVSGGSGGLTWHRGHRDAEWETGRRAHRQMDTHQTHDTKYSTSVLRYIDWPDAIHWLVSGLGKRSHLSYQQDIALSFIALGLQGHEGLCVRIVNLSHTHRCKPSLPLQKNPPKSYDTCIFFPSMTTGLDFNGQHSIKNMTVTGSGEPSGSVLTFPYFKPFAASTH